MFHCFFVIVASACKVALKIWRSQTAGWNIAQYCVPISVPSVRDLIPATVWVCYRVNIDYSLRKYTAYELVVFVTKFEMAQSVISAI